MCRANQFITWLVCSDCQEDSQPVPAPPMAPEVHTAWEMWPPNLPLKRWFFPYFGGNLGNWLGRVFGASRADPANSSLWTLSPPHCQETYCSDISISSPAGTFHLGSSLAQHRRFCCGREAAGCNTMEEYAIRHCCPCSPPRALGPNPRQGRGAQEHDHSVPQGTSMSTAWLDVSRLRLKASKGLKAVSWSVQHNEV